MKKVKIFGIKIIKRFSLGDYYAKNILGLGDIYQNNTDIVINYAIHFSDISLVLYGDVCLFFKNVFNDYKLNGLELTI